MVGDNDSYSNKILQNADEEIARFLKLGEPSISLLQHHLSFPHPELGVLGRDQ
jgi:hypothetical protein